TSYALDGFAHAAEALTGRSVGARRWTEFAQSVRSAAWFSLLTAGTAALAFALGGEALIALLTGLPEVRETASTYLPWMVAMPLIAVWGYLLDGVF
ncbi:MATE family efflux transporter, partial [Vibrio sp. 404]